MARIGHSIIYALTESGQAPTVESIRYIGKTSWKSGYRLWAHIKDVRRGSTLHVHNWMRRLSTDPTIHCLLITSHEDAGFYERLLIAAFKNHGARLTNLTDGGEGVIGLRHSNESRQRMSASHRGVKLGEAHAAKLRDVLRTVARLPQTLAARAKSIKEVTARPEVRAKMSAAAKKRRLTDEDKAKISLTLTGKKQSVETKEKRAAKLRGRKVTDAVLIAIRARNSRPEYRELQRQIALAAWKKRKEVRHR